MTFQQTTSEYVLTEDETIILYKVVFHKQAIYDYVNKLLESAFKCKLEPWPNTIGPEGVLVKQYPEVECAT